METKHKPEDDPDFWDSDDDFDYDDEDDERDYYERLEEQETEEAADRAARCTCGAYGFDTKTGQGFQVADCCCGAY